MNTPQNIYDDGPSHAIPLLETIDLIGLRKNNGIDLVIVVSKKLESDERSQRRRLWRARK